MKMLNKIIMEKIKLCYLSIILATLISSCCNSQEYNSNNLHIQVDYKLQYPEYKIIKFGIVEGKWTDTIVLKRNISWNDGIELFAENDSVKSFYILDKADLICYIKENNFKFIVRNEFIQTSHGCVWIDSQFINDANRNIYIDLSVDEIIEKDRYDCN